MLAGMLDAPEFVINEAQAKEMAKAIDGVAGEYIHAVDPKAMAWVNLTIVCSGIYGGAYMRMSARKRQEKANAKRGNVSLMPNQSNG
jgi:hypothetical protein